MGEQHGSGEVVEVAPPTDDDVAAVLARVLRQAKKDFADLDAAWPEDEYEKGQRESLQRPLGLELPPTPRRRRVAVAHGFSLHADTAVHGNDRQGLERLARYGARGPVAESRLRRLEDGRYEYSNTSSEPETSPSAPTARPFGHPPQPSSSSCCQVSFPLLTPLPAPAELRPRGEFCSPQPSLGLVLLVQHRHERERDDVGSRPLDPCPALFLFCSPMRASLPSSITSMPAGG